MPLICYAQVSTLDPRPDKQAAAATDARARTDVSLLSAIPHNHAPAR
jgi:hypothetical protein